MNEYGPAIQNMNNEIPDSILLLKTFTPRNARIPANMQDKIHAMNRRNHFFDSGFHCFLENLQKDQP